MKRFFVFILVMISVVMAKAETFSYRFSSISLPKAIQLIMRDHPDLEINFIYNELENYSTSATVRADNAYDALRQTVGFNPVTVAHSNDTYYIEALQHGKYVFTGQVMGSDNEPVTAATVMLLVPSDSTVLTYGMTDASGHFSIPCDRQKVLAKLSCLGYSTTYKLLTTFNAGTITLEEKALQLKTVTVEGENATLLNDRSIYRPTQRQKNASQNAVDLLRQMAIPQIQINPLSDEVTSNSGMTVSMFINYLPASKEDLEGLRTLDVRRIEYLEFPTDPRFRGAQLVINIIVQEYDYGGYSKLSVNENIPIGLSSKANLFSKFTYKKMTFDLYTGVNSLNTHHTGNSIEGVYSLMSSEGQEYTLNRKEKIRDSHFKQNQVPVTLRATYASEKVQIRNTLGYTYSGIPVNKQSGDLKFQPSTGNDYTYLRANPNQTNSVNYQSSFFFSLPKKFAIDISPRLIYSHSNDHLTYQSSNSSKIQRNARENAYNYRVDAYFEKNITTNNLIFLGVNGGDNINLLNYSGTNSYRDRFHSAFAAGLLGYQLNTSKIRLYTDAGVCWERISINNTIYYDSYPFLHVNFGYTPNPKNSFSFFFQYANSTPGINMKSPDVLKDNEYMYLTGNPLLGNSRNLMINLGYTWLPSNAFGLSAYGKVNGFFKRQLMVYNPYDDGQSLIRSFVNNGDFLNGEIGLASSLKLFDGKLQLYASPRQNFFKSTGIYRKIYNPFSVVLQATFYLNRFFCQLYYKSPNKRLHTLAPEKYEDCNYHSLAMGWANSNWNIRLTGINFFNRGWVASKTYTETPLYSEYNETIGTSFHPCINLSVTYTLGYGKKVQRGNEVGEQSGASSAILK